jgi:hypothetical protein
MAGRNGSVVSVSESGSTTGAKVHYPAEPGGPGTPPDPPPQAEHDEVYDDVGPERAADFRAALASTVPLKVDCSGTPPNCGGLVLHK